MKRTSSRPSIVVTTDGRGVVSHAGARLLADVADATGLSAAVSEALASLKQRDGGHDPGRVAVDLAVMLADGGEAISDLAVPRNQRDLFGPVASDATAWRVLDAIDATALDRVRIARAQARELAWAQAAETGRQLSSVVGGCVIPGVVVDIDATIVVCHSDKQSAAKTWKKTFGYHPLLAFLDATGEALAGILRAGNSGSNTAADHITVLDLALAQIPDHLRHGQDILIRSDSAGASHAFCATSAVCASTACARSSPSAPRSPHPSAPPSSRVWTGCRPSTPTGICATGPRSPSSPHLLDLSAYPPVTRMIMRRERPHPGAQLSIFDTVEGLRHQVFITDSPRNACSVQLLELRHRAHARVEDRIRTGTNLFATLNVATGAVLADCYPQRTGAEFLAFLRKAVRPHRGKEIHVVLDNLSTHDTPEVQAWLAAHPYVTFHFTPIGSSWTNQIEIWFGIITRQAIRRGTFASVTALIARIHAYVQHWNSAAEPFVWTATADEILAKVRLVQDNVTKLVQNNSK